MAKINSINTDLEIHITDAGYPKDIASRLKEILNDQIFGSTGDVVEYVGFSCDPSEVPIIGCFTVHLKLGTPMNKSECTDRKIYLHGAIDGILAALDFPFSTAIEWPQPAPAEPATTDPEPEAAPLGDPSSFDAQAISFVGTSSAHAPVLTPGPGPAPAPRPTAPYAWEALHVPVPRTQNEREATHGLMMTMNGAG